MHSFIIWYIMCGLLLDLEEINLQRTCFQKIKHFSLNHQLVCWNKNGGLKHRWSVLSILAPLQKKLEGRPPCLHNPIQFIIVWAKWVKHISRVLKPPAVQWRNSKLQCDKLCSHSLKPSCVLIYFLTSEGEVLASYQRIPHGKLN